MPSAAAAVLAFITKRRVRRRRLEAVVAVEVGRCLVEGVDDDEPPAADRHGVEDPLKRKREQVSTSPFAVQILGQGESGEQVAGDGVGCASADPRRDVGSLPGGGGARSTR